jgi:predicted regulator of Ras-like GTPase activity (Roadblock/LC7/MglB family)
MTSGSFDSESELALYKSHREGKLDSILYRIIEDYRRSFGTGLIETILLIDEDAKMLASASPYESGGSIYDLGVLSAALYGIAAQGPERFGCEDFNTCLVTWKDRQIFIQSIGMLKVNGENNGGNARLEERRKARVLILAALTDERINIGLMRVKMKEVVGEILKSASESSPVMRLLDAKEEDVERLIKDLSNEITPISQR